MKTLQRTSKKGIRSRAHSLFSIMHKGFVLAVWLILSPSILTDVQGFNQGKPDAFFDRLNDKNEAMGSLIIVKV